MKKLTVGVLCILFALFLCACGSGTSSSNDEPLTESEIASLFSDPDQFKGRTVELVGKVDGGKQVDGDTTAFQMFCDWENYDQGVIVVQPTEDVTVEDGDFVTIKGTVDGMFEGENAFGATLSYPQISASSVEVSSYAEIAAPTKKEVIPENNSVDQYGYVVTVDKIELADSETRVYVTVTNSGSETFNFYDFNCKIVQGDKQYDATDNYDAGYEEVQSEILPGISSSGVIVFDAIEECDFTLLLDGYSDDYSIDFDDYKYDVTIE